MNRQRMKRVLLVAAALAVSAQPLASLPRFGKQAPRERSAGILQRVAPRPCPVDTPRATTGDWTVGTALARVQGVLSDVRHRTEPVRDRCLPRRECFTDRSQAGREASSDPLFRTPSIVGK